MNDNSAKPKSNSSNTRPFLTRNDIVRIALNELDCMSVPIVNLNFWPCPECGEENPEEDCKCNNCGHVHCSDE